MDVLELFALALVNHSEAKGQRSSSCCAFLLQQLQQKFAAAAKGNLPLYLLSVAEAVLKEEYNGTNKPSRTFQVG